MCKSSIPFMKQTTQMCFSATREKILKFVHWKPPYASPLANSILSDKPMCLSNSLRVDLLWSHVPPCWPYCSTISKIVESGFHTLSHMPPHATYSFFMHFHASVSNIHTRGPLLISLWHHLKTLSSPHQQPSKVDTSTLDDITATSASS